MAASPLQQIYDGLILSNNKNETDKCASLNICCTCYLDANNELHILFIKLAPKFRNAKDVNL